MKELCGKHFYKIIIFYTFMAGGFQLIDQFYGATYLLKMNEQGLSLFNISLILGILDLVNAIVDYPSGVISDYIGRKKTAGISLIIYSIGLLIFALANSVAIYIVSSVIIAVALALYSGSPAAWFYDIMVKYDMVSKRGEIMPKMATVVRVFAILANGISFLLVLYSVKWPLFCSAVISFGIGILYLCSFEDNKGKTEGMSFGETLLLFSSKFLKDGRMRLIVIYDGISYVATAFFVLEWQLYLVNEFGIQKNYISLILILFMFCMMIGGYIAGKFSKFKDVFAGTYIGKIVMAVSLIMILFSDNLILLLISMGIFEIALSMCSITESIWVNDYIEADNRASFYSAISALLKLFGFFIILLAGYIVNQFGYVFGWKVCFATNIISALALLFFVKKYGNSFLYNSKCRE